MANAKKMDQVILGLLSHTPMTGYDIKKRMDTTLRLFWNASYGSIYPTLTILESEGKVTKESFTENGREKIIYTITEKGRKTLKEWLAKPVLKDELRYETLLKLFFGSEIGPEMTAEHIEAFEEKIRGELPFLEESVEQLSKATEEEAHKYYMLTAMFGVKVYKSYLEWCEEAKKILKK
ncbi:MAG: PadR family transcriptional regulator [bacterium]|nr:PadR family transcriptional regulator [bacterium]